MNEEKKAIDFDPEALQKQIQDHIKKHGGTVAVGGAEFVQNLIRTTYQAMLDAEMEEHLGYPSNGKAAKDTANRRNGKSSKTVRGDFGQVEIATPRDRSGTFTPKAIGKRQTSVDGFADKIISLYARGMTTREIEDHLQEMYGIEVSPAFVSRVTERVLEEVTEWQNRALEPLYPVVYMDGLRVTVRDEGVVKKKVVYICLGVNPVGLQDVLGMWIADSEGAAFWLGVLNDLKSRGVQDILIACVDGLKGLPEAIEAAFPKTDVQLCVVHQIRNSTKFISFKDRKAFCRDLKEVYGAPTIEAAAAAFTKIEQNWGAKYPASLQSWKNNWDRVTTFFRYPVELRRVIYTTNGIESLNSQLRKNTSNRKVFPSDEAALKLLFLNVRNCTRKWSFRQNWGMVMNQLAVMFPDRVRLDAIS
jgi:transposase-like protein